MAENPVVLADPTGLRNLPLGIRGDGPDPLKLLESLRRHLKGASRAAEELERFLQNDRPRRSSPDERAVQSR